MPNSIPSTRALPQRLRNQPFPSKIRPVKVYQENWITTCFASVHANCAPTIYMPPYLFPIVYGSPLRSGREYSFQRSIPDRLLLCLEQDLSYKISPFTYGSPQCHPRITFFPQPTMEETSYSGLLILFAQRWITAVIHLCANLRGRITNCVFSTFFCTSYA